MTIRIGHLSTFYHTATLLMPGGALARDLRVDTEWRLFGTCPAIMDAFSREELDLAYIGLPPAIIGIADGVDIRCVAGGHMDGTVFSGRAGSLSYPQTEDLAQILGQFSGQKIGVPGKGSIHDVILAACLARYNLQDRIEIVNFAWADAILESFRKDEVAAAFGTPALAVALRRYADAEVLFPPDMLCPNNPSYGILVRRRFLHDHLEGIEHFLDAHEAATALIRKDPQTASRAIANCVKVVDENFVLETLLVSPRYCGQLTAPYIASTLWFVEVMRSLGYIHTGLQTSDIFDSSLMDRIHGPGDHYRSMVNVCRIQPVIRI